MSKPKFASIQQAKNEYEAFCKEQFAKYESFFQAMCPKSTDSYRKGLIPYPQLLNVAHGLLRGGE